MWRSSLCHCGCPPDALSLTSATIFQHCQSIDLTSLRTWAVATLFIWTVSRHVDSLVVRLSNRRGAISMTAIHLPGKTRFEGVWNIPRHSSLLRLPGT
ncbi:hypothetical protein BDV11DRAFT_190100 [Aspergillus similis]